MSCIWIGTLWLGSKSAEFLDLICLMGSHLMGFLLVDMRRSIFDISNLIIPPPTSLSVAVSLPQDPLHNLPPWVGERGYTIGRLYVWVEQILFGYGQTLLGLHKSRWPFYRNMLTNMIRESNWPMLIFEGSILKYERFKIPSEK